MKLPEINALRLYNILLVLAGIALLLSNALLLPIAPIQPIYAVIVLLFIALLANLPLRLLQREITLIQAITLGVGLLYGVPLATLLATLGILIGYGIRRIRSASPGRRALPVEVGITLGMQLIPLTLSLELFNLPAGSDTTQTTIFLGDAALSALLFALVHTALFQIGFWLHAQPPRSTLFRDLVSLGLVELLPLPFVLVSVAAFDENRMAALILLGGIPAILAVLMHTVSTARTDLERRLQDLSTLHYISRTLRSTLDMDNLLTVIHQQVTQLLGVDNFYVALFDLDNQELWYPLAVKNGERRDWPRRPLTDRLTDRVIRERRPILLAKDARQELERIGLPPSEDAPYAWLGVPLITSDRTIGCLAVFSISPDVEFTPADLDLLTILSGQVSVAIENALLYDQAHRRATQLDTLNRTSTLITASLDLREVLAQVCRSVTLVSGAQRSAIYLIEPGQDEIQLAHAHGLSPTFVEANRAFSRSLTDRTRCLRTGRPALTPNLNELSRDLSFVQSFENEDIRAVGDFPLTTPDGQIGFLSVYFDEPHNFIPEQVELLQIFASQAALAVANARLHARTDQALSRRAQQLAILERIARELAAVIQSERLFDMILDHALEFTGSPWGSVNLYDARSRTIEIKASKGYVPESTEQAVGRGITGRVIETRQAVLVGDVRADPDFVDLSNDQVRSQLSVPMMYEDRVLGVITLESPEQDAFDHRDLNFLRQVATQAAIAVVNAALYTETQRRLREQTTLYQASKRLVGNLNLSQVAQTIAQAVSESLHGLSTGVYLWQRETAAYALQALERPRSERGHTFLESIPEATLGDLSAPGLESGSPVLLQHGENTEEVLGACDECQAVIFPLRVAEERLGIVLTHLPARQTIPEETLQLPRAIVAQGAIAIQNALLFADVAEGHDQMEALLNSVDEGVLMVDAGGYVMLGNVAMENFMGVSLDEMESHRLVDLPDRALDALGFTPSQAEDLDQHLGQGHQSVALKATVQTGGADRTRVLDRVISPVLGQGRRVLGWVFVVRDVSEEHQLNQARELITETLVHDLRSPVGAIDSALTLLDESLPPESDQQTIPRQSLDIARRSTHRVMNLIESLLDISRMETGSIDLNITALDIHTLASDLLAEFIPEASELGILLQNELPRDLPSVQADREKISRVLANLLDNALKFTPEGGKVALSGEVRDDGMVVVRVRDTGPGIPAEYQEKIFDRFSQIPDRRGRRRGSGLGLTFVRLAVEAHGGEVWVEPSAGEGSVFTFTLPMEAHDSRGEP